MMDDRMRRTGKAGSSECILSNVIDRRSRRVISGQLQTQIKKYHGRGRAMDMALLSWTSSSARGE
jgi:hypothetical protein